ncbi:hypothetical protein ACFWCA_32600 [Streptomyces phaeochromogenes]|uniref:hypothetical protein n=1 Tax=Streptomyces phaeochromogenes TaxID=1923 RepID=UPI0036A35DAE
MTDHQFTDDDLRAAAALMHYALTIEPAPADAHAALGENPRWLLVDPGSDEDDNLREATVELVSKAADISRWAVDLGADGLEPEEHQFTLSAGPKPIIRVHFGFAPELDDEARAAFVQGLGAAAAREMRLALEENPAPTISMETAAHVLFQERLGGWPPSTFASKLLDLWTSADTDNAEHLADAFPEYAAAIALLKSGQPGIEQLRAIAPATAARIVR